MHKHVIYQEPIDKRPPCRMEQYYTGKIWLESTYTDLYGNRKVFKQKLTDEALFELIKMYTDERTKNIDEPREWWEPYLKSLTCDDNNVYFYEVEQEYLD